MIPNRSALLTCIPLILYATKLFIFCDGIKDVSRRHDLISKVPKRDEKITPISEDEHEKEVLSALFRDEVSSSYIYDRSEFRSGDRIMRRKRKFRKQKKVLHFNQTKCDSRKFMLEKKESSLKNNNEIKIHDNVNGDTITPSNPSEYTQNIQTGALNLKKEIDLLRNITRVEISQDTKYPAISQSRADFVDKKDDDIRPATTMSLTSPWARKFILSRPKDALLPIPIEFLSDGFNLVNIASVISKMHRLNENSNMAQESSLYKDSIKLILEEDEEKMNSFQIPEEVQHAAEIIYHIVHARFICSPRGLDMVRRMFQKNLSNHFIHPIFGRCSRITCDGTPLLPFGVSHAYDIQGRRTADRKAMRYCCNCKEVSCFALKLSSDFEQLSKSVILSCFFNFSFEMNRFSTVGIPR